jgi:hypothetical protein
VVGREWRRGRGSGGGGVVMLGPRCRSSLAHIVALGGAGPPLLFVVGACGPSLPFVVGARRCLGWCWAAVAVRRWCVWALVAVRLWRASLPFVVGTRRCRFSLACAVAVCRCLGWYCGGVVVRGGSSCSVGGRRVPCAIVIRGWGIVVVRGWGIVVCGWGSLLSVGGRCGHGWGIVVVRGCSSFGWWVVVEQGGRRLRARSPSIGGGGVSSVVCHRYLLVTEFQRLGLGGRAHQWTTNEIRRSSSGCHVADGDVAPGMQVSKGRGERGKPTYFGW